MPRQIPERLAEVTPQPPVPDVDPLAHPRRRPGRLAAPDPLRRDQLGHRATAVREVEHLPPGLPRVPIDPAGGDHPVQRRVERPQRLLELRVLRWRLGPRPGHLRRGGRVRHLPPAAAQVRQPPVPEHRPHVACEPAVRVAPGSEPPHDRRSVVEEVQQDLVGHVVPAPAGDVDPPVRARAGARREVDEPAAEPRIDATGVDPREQRLPRGEAGQHATILSAAGRCRSPPAADHGGEEPEM